jgi:hypothetical protein
MTVAPIARAWSIAFARVLREVSMVDSLVVAHRIGSFSAHACPGRAMSNLRSGGRMDSGPRGSTGWRLDSMAYWRGMMSDGGQEYDVAEEEESA